jgi:hypothetical protein
MAEDTRRFQVLDLYQNPIPGEWLPREAGKTLLKIWFLDEEVVNYSFPPELIAPYESAIREAIETQRVYWVHRLDTSSAFTATNSPPLPQRVLEAIQKQQLVDDAS